MYKHSHIKRLREKNSLRAKRGWRIRHLRMEADPREATFEEIVERDKRDRKGKYYATMERDGLKLTLYHSMNRSDQFDVIAVRPSRWSGAHGISELHDDLSMPKVIKLFSKVA